jgi:small subunit ribosomal protein S1
MSQTTITTPDAKIVEGSDGLLLEIDGQIVPNYDATFSPFEEGDVVSGRVVRIDNDEVLVDIGYKSEGVIPSNELSIRKNVDPHEEVELGEEVDALVLTKEDQDGRLIVSKKRARFEKAWRRIEAAAESGEPVEGTVIEVVKGGLIIDLGVRGFLPASLVDIRRVPNLDEFMGTKIETKVIELNRSRNNVVLSRRAVLEEERKEQRQEILDRLQPGLVVEGQISNIVDFGAFVDLNGIDGLIHISELSWSHVNHPSEILSIGDTVQVKVLDIDRDRQRISLGLKQTQEDPWQRVVDTYNVGDELEGTVTKVVTSARSSRSSTASRASSISPSWPTTTSRTRARSSSRATTCAFASSRSTPTAAGSRCRSSAWRARSCRAATWAPATSTTSRSSA